MKFLILTALVVTSFNLLYSQTISVKEKGNALISRMTGMHVKPPMVNDQFGSNVNKRLLELIDSEHFIFSLEDLAELNTKSQKIDDDLTGKTSEYIDLLKSKLNVRITEMETAVGEFALKPVDLKSAKTITRSQLEKSLPKTELKKRLNDILYLSVIDRILTQEGDSPKIPSDLASAEAKARKEVVERYTTFLKRIKETKTLEEAYLNSVALEFDPHSLYFSASEKKMFEAELSSDRLIYGFNIQENEQQEVILSDLVPGSAAWLSNSIHSGDIVESLQFEGEELITISGIKTAEETHVIFQESLTDKVKLNLKSTNGEKKTVSLTKSKVYSDSDIIKNAVLKSEKKIGYISLPDFYMNWTDTSNLGCANDLAKCLLKLKQENIEGVILDLRGNGGGSLKEAVDLSGIFIDYGPVLAIKSRERGVSVLKDFNRGAIYTGPLMVLIDEGSASASEIVAGVLQDYNKAIIVGRQSFGKATSQSILPVDPAWNELSAAFIEEKKDYGYVNMTNGLLYRVTGKWNQSAGVTPDIELPLNYGDEEPETERTYTNALTPDPIDKKMVFTPAPAIPVTKLKALSESRRATDKQFAEWEKLQADYAAYLRKDTIEYLNITKKLEKLAGLEVFSKRIDALSENLQCGFEPSANKFDSEVYAADEMLSRYNETFLAGLKKDIELTEAVNILEDLISEQKK